MAETMIPETKRAAWTRLPLRFEDPMFIVNGVYRDFFSYFPTGWLCENSRLEFPLNCVFLTPYGARFARFLIDQIYGRSKAGFPDQGMSDVIAFWLAMPEEEILARFVLWELRDPFL